MAKVVINVSMSLDGFVAGPNVATLVAQVAANAADMPPVRSAKDVK